MNLPRRASSSLLSEGPKSNRSLTLRRDTGRFSALWCFIPALKGDSSQLIWSGGLILVGLGLSLVTAQLVVDGAWPIALGIILALPALILLHKYPLLGLMLWLLLAPFLVVTQGGGIRRVYWVIHRALPPATIGILLLSHFLRVHRRRLPRLGWAELAMAGYVTVSAVSVIYLSDEVAATLYLLYDRVFVPMCLYLLVRLTMPDEKDLTRLLPVILFLLISQSVIGILSWTAPGVLPKAWLGRAGLRTTGSLRNYGVFSTTVVFAGLFIFQRAMYHRPNLLRLGYLASFILAMFMVFLSFSRGSWLGGLVAVWGLFYLYPRFMLRLSAVVTPLVLLIISVLLANYLSFAQSRLYSDGSQESALSRLPVFYAAYRMFEAKPLFGWGYGNFDRYDRQFQERVGDLINPEKDLASHNLYLTIIAEQGITGITLFLAPMVWWLALTLKALPKMPPEGFWSRKLMIIFWLVILDHFIVNNFTNMKVVFGLGMWWITLGLIAHLVYVHLTPAPAGAPAPARAAPPAL